eukprot:TRINITY_DN93561_c0_g1_i1.p1 TRINITY_DN93561_c0_g1~~TRINITY_DN93561_c0_g1_i1.p1  ORF type:complete len:240 (+),score=33.18 TRINITY_DN93561_c0_g1_i1:57-722(+)
MTLPPIIRRQPFGPSADEEDQSNSSVATSRNSTPAQSPSRRDSKQTRGGNWRERHKEDQLVSRAATFDPPLPPPLPVVQRSAAPKRKAAGTRNVPWGLQHDLKFRSLTIPLGLITQARKAFAHIDQEGKGRVDWYALGIALFSLPSKAPAIGVEGLEQMIAQIDANADGFVDFWEFFGSMVYDYLQLQLDGTSRHALIAYCSQNWESCDYNGAETDALVVR